MTYALISSQDKDGIIKLLIRKDITVYSLQILGRYSMP